MTRAIPIMRRPDGLHANPLLVDQVVYVRRGRTDAETEQLIAEACAASGIEHARAVACIESPPEGKRAGAKGRRKGSPRKGASGLDDGRC